MRIETEYHPHNQHVSVTYDATIQLLFQKTSQTISDVFDPETYTRVCRELGETGPHDIACGAELLKKLGSSRLVTANGDEFVWALSPSSRGLS